MPSGGSSIPHLILEDNSPLRVCFGAQSAKRKVLPISALDLDPASSGSPVNQPRTASQRLSLSDQSLSAAYNSDGYWQQHIYQKSSVLSCTKQLY